VVRGKFGIFPQHRNGKPSPSSSVPAGRRHGDGGDAIDGRRGLGLLGEEGEQDHTWLLRRESAIRLLLRRADARAAASIDRSLGGCQSRASRRWRPRFVLHMPFG